MHRDSLFAGLSVLTRGLRAGPGTRPSDLDEARVLVAREILRGRGAAITALRPSSDVSAVGAEDPPESTALLNIVDSVIAELAKDPESAADVRIFRREYPALTPQLPNSVPPWAAGWLVDRTLGPFLDQAGRSYWFDVRRTLRQIQVTGGPGGPVLFVIPLGGSPHASEGYTLPGGTVWIRSRLIAADAVDGAFTGLSIQSGSLKLSAVTTVGANVIVVSPAAQIELDLNLESPAAAPQSSFSAVAADADSAKVTLPATVSIRASGTGTGSISAVGPASVTAYGTAAALEFAAAPARYDKEVNQILVPFNTDATVFRAADVQSDLFQPAGSAPIISAFWVLATLVPEGDPSQLGPAAGIGGIGLGLLPGLTAIWTGLRNRIAQNGSLAALGPTLLVVEPGQLSVSSPVLNATSALMSVLLWEERETSRRSSIDLTFPSAVPTLFVSRSGPNPAEVLVFTSVKANAHLDRPVAADGGKLTIQSSQTRVELIESGEHVSVFVTALVAFSENDPPAAPTALALQNLFIRTSPPLGIFLHGITRAGALVDGNLAVDSGFALVAFRIVLAIPTLPDPYASSFDYQFSRGRSRGEAFNDSVSQSPDLAAIVSWKEPSAATVQTLLLNQDSASPETSPLAWISSRSQAGMPTRSFAVPQGPDPQSTRNDLLEAFGQITSSSSELFRLLDVSSNADQFGVALGFQSHPRKFVQPIVLPRLQGLDLVAPANSIRVLTLPAFQWEPVRNIPNPNAAPFPDALISDTDGGPTRIGVNSVALIPVAPLPAAASILSFYNDNGNPDAVVALNTALPFGMLALAELRKSSIFELVSSGLAGNQPDFPTAQVSGGLQLSFSSGGLLLQLPQLPSRSFVGAAVQTSNAYDPSNPSTPTSVLGTHGGAIFNGEFSPSASSRRVPLARIDISGYGASLFNDWRDPTAEIAATSEVRFEATVGRTALEVVQIKSICYPWGFSVVRTFTMQRTGGGGVFRRDSGWVASSDGVYDFKYVRGGVTTDPGIVVHPGTVKAFRAVRHIQDTTQVYSRTYPPGDPQSTVSLAAIRFDADVEVEHVTTGANSSKRVPVHDIVGYVQLQPRVPLTPGQLDDLLAQQGPVGGAIDCLFSIGASQLQMRTNTFAASRTMTGGGNPQVAVAIRGSVILPQAGQWSFTWRLASEREPHSLDPHAAIPLIQQNPVGGVSQAYRFADPEDLFQPATPSSEYGILQSSDTQRLLVRTPMVETGRTAITSAAPFLLADVFALAGGVSLFPQQNLCIRMPDHCSLEAPAPGQLRLAIPPQPGSPPDSFIVLAPTERIITNVNSSLTLHAVYADENALRSVVTWRIDSTATPDWSFSMGPLSVLGDIGSFPGLMRVIGTLSAQSGRDAQLAQVRLVFGNALSPVQKILNILTEIGFPVAFPLALTRSTLKIQSGIVLDIPPHILKKQPDGSTTLEDGKPFDIGIGELNGELKAGFGNEAEVGDTLFTALENWRMYFELSGDIKFSPLPPGLVKSGGAFKLQIEGQANEPPKITLEVGSIGAIGRDLFGGALKVEGSVRYSYVLQFKGSQIGFGIDLEFKAEIEVVKGLAGAEVSAEAMAIASRKDAHTVNVSAEFTLGFELTLGWVFNESFEVQAKYDQDVNMELFIAAALLAAGQPELVL